MVVVVAMGMMMMMVWIIITMRYCDDSTDFVLVYLHTFF